MLLFFDTETTGKYDFKSPLDSVHQPHLVQIAAVLIESRGDERSLINMIINPGVNIPDEAANIHGITNELANRVGLNPQIALGSFGGLLSKASFFHRGISLSLPTVGFTEQWMS